MLDLQVERTTLPGTFNYLQGEIEFGVINQSVSAFNHILTDVSLVVYQVRMLLVVASCVQSILWHTPVFS